MNRLRALARRPEDGSGSIEHRGCRLAYRVRGDGEPVVMIQGVATAGDAWQPQIDGLVGDHRCLSFDHRGLGRSQPRGEPVSVAQLADDTRELMRAQGWASAHVVGHSLGGQVALELALRAPECVRTLSLLCTFARGLDATRLSAYMFWWGLRTRIGTRRQRRNAFLQLVVPPAALAASDLDALAEQLGQAFGRDLADVPPIVAEQMSAMRSYDATSRLHRLARIPTLVVSASHDRIARPELGRALAAGIPGSTFVELEAAAHAVIVQQPERVNALLREHFRGGR